MVDFAKMSRENQYKRTLLLERFTIMDQDEKIQKMFKSRTWISAVGRARNMFTLDIRDAKDLVETYMEYRNISK